jgi:hypothetical protein
MSLTALFLLLCILTLFLWRYSYRSYSYADYSPNDHRYYDFSLYPGRLYVYRCDTLTPGPRGWNYLISKDPYNESFTYLAWGRWVADSGYNYAGVSFDAYGEPADHFATVGIKIPFAYIAITFATFPTLYLFHYTNARRRKRKMAAGLCPTCHYDLRAHAAGGKCPECGNPIQSIFSTI